MKITKLLLSIFLTFVIILVSPVAKKSTEVAEIYYATPTSTAPYADQALLHDGESLFVPVTEEEDETEVKEQQENEPQQQTTTAAVEEVSLYKTRTTSNSGELDIDFLAKLLYAEAGSMGFEGQVWTCSAILNFCERNNVSLWSAGHNKNMFEVAPIVDNATPNQTTYDVIDYVLNGNRVAEVCYFRTKHYHNFGTPVRQIENVYFSKP